VSATPHRSYRRSVSDDEVQLQIRLPQSLRDRLIAEATRRTVSTNLLAERAIEQSVAAWEKQKLP
jgi:hypothetical protein